MMSRIFKPNILFVISPKAESCGGQQPCQFFISRENKLINYKYTVFIYSYNWMWNSSLQHKILQYTYSTIYFLFVLIFVRIRHYD